MSQHRYGSAHYRPNLITLVAMSKYPCYAKEVEQMRQQRMSSRLEWRRQMRRTMAKNKVYVAACWYGLVVGVIVSLVLLSELLRVTVWTLLR